MRARSRYLTSLAVALVAVISSTVVAIAALVPAATPSTSAAPAFTTSPKNSVAPTVSATTPTGTTVSGSPNPASFTSPASAANVMLTANVSVTDGSGLTVSEGTVTFVDGARTLGSSPVTNGQATLVTSLAQGTHQIVGNYADTGSVFAASAGSFDQRVNAAAPNPTFGSGPGPYTYCNTGSITAPAPGFESGAASLYPSNIFVTNLPGTVNAVTVTLNGLSTNDQGDLLSLLVGPGGNNFEFFALTGSSVSNAPSPINLVFSDSSATFIAEGSGGNLFSSGTFKPTSYNTNIKYPQCPANASGCANPPVGPPLPSNPFTPTNKAPAAGTNVMGSANEAGVFGGTTSSTYNGNGTWSLYLDDGGPTSGHGEITNLTGGWCVNLTENLPSVGVSAAYSGPGVSGNLVAGAQGSLTVDISNLGPSSTGDPTGGSNPLTVTDTLNAALTYTGFSGTGWNCSVASGQTVTCKNDSAVAQGDSYGTLALNVNVSSSAPSSFTNAVSVTGGGVTPTSASDLVRVDAAAVLQVQKSHTGNFTAGQTAQWSINVTNEAANGSTFATISMSDPLPVGYTLASYTSTASAWSCIGTTIVTCTSSEAISAGLSSTITLTVNVPVNSPVSVTNTARAWGGGDLVHTNSGSATTGSDNATVTPAATPVLVIAKSHSGTFTAGSTATWMLQVSNNGTTAAAATSGATVTVLDTLPAGFTLASFTGTGWSCAGTPTVACTSTAVIAGGGANFPLISLNVNVPVSSPSSVSNVASVFGGGDVTHTSAGAAALSNTDTVSVTQAQPSPTVASYKALFGAQSFNLIGSARNRLPWEITAIQVVFSQPITTANVNSLTGVTTTGFTGLGTNTLTWSISPIPIGSCSTVLLASGANAIKGASGNALNAGTNFTQNFKVLWGDFNDDGAVDASDAVLVNAARSSAYNIFADVNGDGVVNATDVNVVRTRIGTSQP
ncbi:MAG: dockerin type I repeat-containing protein [Candidatus Acidiferrales bacterium]